MTTVTIRSVLLALLLCPVLGFSQAAAPISGFCVNGAKPAIFSGLPSSNLNQGLIPKCTVTVVLTGTTIKATIYADKNLTPLTNPFTANADASWTFYAGPGTYDATLSGGIAPNTYSAPRTVVGLSLSSGGGGGGSCGPLAADPTSTNCGNGNLSGITLASGLQLQAFGANNLNNGNLFSAVAMGTGNGNDAVSATWLVGIGDTNASGLGSGTSVVAIGDNNANPGSATSITGLTAIGSQMSTGIADHASLSFIAGLGYRSNQDFDGTFSSIVAIGDSSNQKLKGNFADIHSVGSHNNQNLTGSMDEVTSIGSFNGFSIDGNVFAILGLGTSNVSNFTGSISDVMGIGDNSGNNYGDQTEFVIGIGETTASGPSTTPLATVNNVIGIGLNAADENISNDVVAIGNNVHASCDGSQHDDVVVLGHNACADAPNEVVLGDPSTTTKTLLNAATFVASATPTCDAAHRFMLNTVPGGAGVKDIVQICAKDASDAYAWRSGDGDYLPKTGGTLTGPLTLSDAALAISQNYAPVSISAFGAVCNASGLILDGVLTSPTAFSSASMTFSNADAGKVISILGAGPNQTSFTTTIQSVTGPHDVILASSASLSSGTALSFRYGTDDTAAINNAILSGKPLINPPNAACLVAGSLSMPKGVKQLNWQYNNATFVFTGDGGGVCARQTNGLVQLHPAEGSPIYFQGPGILQATNSNANCIVNFSQTLANSGDGFSHNFRSDGMTYVGVADTPSIRGTNNLGTFWSLFSGEWRFEHNLFQTFGASDIIATGTSNQSDIINIDHNDFQGTYHHAPHISIQNTQGLSIDNNNMETSMVSIVSSGPANVSFRNNWYGDGCAGLLTTTIASVARDASGVVTIVYTAPHHLGIGSQPTYTGLTVDPAMNGLRTVTAVPNTLTVQFAQAGAVIATTPDTAGSSFTVTDIPAAVNLSGGAGMVDSNFIFSQNCHGLATGIALSGAASFGVTGNSINSFGTGISTAGTSANQIFGNQISNAATNIDIESSANYVGGNTFANGPVGINVGAGTGNDIRTNINFASSFINCTGGSNSSIMNNSGAFVPCQGTNDVNIPGTMHALGGTLGWGPAGSVQIATSSDLYSAKRLNSPFNFFVTSSFMPSHVAQNSEMHAFSSGAPDTGCFPISAGGGDGSGSGTAAAEYFLLVCGAGSSAGTGLVLYQGGATPTKILQVDSTGIHLTNGAIQVFSSAKLTTGCTTAATSFSVCSNTLNWTPSLSATPSSVQCTGIGPSDPRAYWQVSSYNNTSVTVNTVTGGPVAVNFGEIDCIAKP